MVELLNGLLGHDPKLAVLLVKDESKFKPAMQSMQRSIVVQSAIPS